MYQIGGGTMRVHNKKLEFPEDIKDKIKSYLPTKTLEITYIEGQILSLEGTNMDVINPYKVLIKKDKKEIILLFYQQFYYDQDAFFIYDLQHKGTWQMVKDLLK